MKEIVEKKEVEELLGCEITDEQFEEALKYARHKQEYIYQREHRQVVLQHWYLVKLTEEYVRSLAFSKFTMDLCRTLQDTKKTTSICSFLEDEGLMGIMLEKVTISTPTAKGLHDIALCQIGRMSRFWHISIIIIWLCRLYMIGKMAIYVERILGQQGNGQEVQRMPGAKSMRLTAP